MVEFEILGYKLTLYTPNFTCLGARSPATHFSRESLNPCIALEDNETWNCECPHPLSSSQTKALNFHALLNKIQQSESNHRDMIVQRVMELIVVPRLSLRISAKAPTSD